MAEILKEQAELVGVAVDEVPIATGGAGGQLVGELFVEAALTLVEVEVVALRPVLGKVVRQFQDDRPRCAERFAVVAQRQSGELADDADADADGLVADLCHRRGAVEHTPVAQAVGDERRRRLLGLVRQIAH